MARDHGLTTAEIRQWIDADQSLNRWYRQSSMTKRDFIRANRSNLSRIIRALGQGEKRPHYESFR